MMNLPRRCELQEIHHDPPIQKASALAVRVQVSYRVLPEVALSNLQRRGGTLYPSGTARVVSAQRGCGGAGTEYPAGSYPSGGVDSAEIRGVGLHGVSEREAGIAVVPPIRTLGQAVLGAAFVGDGVLCQYHRVGRRTDSQIRQMARRSRKAS